MAQTKQRSKKSRKKTQTTGGIFHDRQRKLSKFENPDVLPTTRVLRSQTRAKSSDLAPNDTDPCTQPEKRIKAERKRQQRKEWKSQQTNQRRRLTTTLASDVVDLTEVGIGADDTADRPPADAHFFDLDLSLGFLGYSERTDPRRETVDIGILGRPESFGPYALEMLRSHCRLLGMWQKLFRISAYEICFPTDYLCDSISIQSGRPVLVCAGKLLMAWVEQVKIQPGEKNVSIVVRVVNQQGSIFKPVSRTPNVLRINATRQRNAQAIAPEESVEPGMQDSSNNGLSKSKKKRKKRLSHREREEAAGLKQRGRDIERAFLAPSPINQQDQRLSSEMDSLQQLMARQNISGGRNTAGNHENPHLQSCEKDNVSTPSVSKYHESEEVGLDMMDLEV